MLRGLFGVGRNWLRVRRNLPSVGRGLFHMTPNLFTPKAIGTSGKRPKGVLNKQVKLKIVQLNERMKLLGVEPDLTVAQRFFYEKEKEARTPLVKQMMEIARDMAAKNFNATTDPEFAAFVKTEKQNTTEAFLNYLAELVSARNKAAEQQKAKKSAKRPDKTLARLLRANPSVVGLIDKAESKWKQLQSIINKNDPAFKKLMDEIVALLVQIKYDTGGQIKDTMDEVIVTFKIGGKIVGDPVEFMRQLRMQGEAINAMTVGDLRTNRAKFLLLGRDLKTDTKLMRREALIAKLIANPDIVIRTLTNQRLLTTQDGAIIRKILNDHNITDKNKALSSIAKQIMDSYGSQNLDVLHKLDQVAGGPSTIYGDIGSIFGGSPENSEIGRQWRALISGVDEAMKGVNPNAKVNFKLHAIE